MKISDSKSDLLTNRMIPIWNLYIDIENVPESHKDQISLNDGYQLMAQASDPVTNVNGIYAWNGQSWATVGQANAAIAADAMNSLPSNPVIGRLVWYMPENKLVVFSHSGWVDTNGNAI